MSPPFSPGFPMIITYTNSPGSMKLVQMPAELPLRTDIRIIKLNATETDWKAFTSQARGRP